MWSNLTSHALHAYSVRVPCAQITDSSKWDTFVAPIPEPTLADIGAIRHDLGKLLGMKVALLILNAPPDNFRT